MPSPQGVLHAVVMPPSRQFGSCVQVLEQPLASPKNDKGVEARKSVESLERKADGSGRVAATSGASAAEAKKLEEKAADSSDPRRVYELILARYESAPEWSRERARAATRTAGIPADLRRKLWPLLAGSDDLVAKNAGVFEELNSKQST